MPDITTFDRSITLFLNRFADVDPAFDHLILDIANSALVNGGLFMAYFWSLWFENDECTTERRQSVLVSIFGALLAILISRILQLALPFHDRPLHTPDLGFVLPSGVNPNALSHWNSFPSDHAVLFFALTTAIWYENRRLGYVAALWSFFVICLPRVYLGYHFPSDIVGGMILGVTLMVGVRFFLRNARWPTRLLNWSALHQTAFYCVAFLASYEITILFYDLRALSVDGFHIVKSMIIASAWAR